MVHLLIDSAHSEGRYHTLEQFTNEWHAILDCDRELLTAPLSELPRVTEAGSTVLVLVAPTRDLRAQEIERLLTFIHDGGSVFLAYDNKSLDMLRTDCLEILGEHLGFRPKMYRQMPPQMATWLSVHYATTGISKLAIGQTAALEVLDNDFIPLVDLDETNKVVGCTHVGQGRVVISADVHWLADTGWNDADNAEFARNIMRWLTSTNPVDCRMVPAANEVIIGEPAAFSLILSNPHNTTLDRIQCELESDHMAAVTTVAEPIRFLPPGSQTWVQWSVIPKMLGKQCLRLRVVSRYEKQRHTLMFPVAARFNAIADAELSLRFQVESSQDAARVMLDQPFLVVGQVDWQSPEKRAPVTLELEISERTAFHLDEAESQDDTARHWHLTARKAGDHTLTLILSQTGQKVQRRIQVQSGLGDL